MDKYIHTLAIHNKRSPAILVPEIIKLFNPQSVVDVGCGTGTFLAVFKEHGVEEVLGLEGEWLNEEMVEVDKKFIVTTDLEKPFSYPKRFDLAICLEVAEHLSDAASDTITGTLTELSDVILFSAAVPGQWGQNHINEQWAEYWQEKFREKGYIYYDEIRFKIWNNKEIDWWYKQNTFVVIKEGKNNFGFKENQKIYNFIHPELLTESRELTKVIDSGKLGIGLYVSAILKKILHKTGIRK